MNWLHFRIRASQQFVCKQILNLFSSVLLQCCYIATHTDL